MGVVSNKSLILLTYGNASPGQTGVQAAAGICISLDELQGGATSYRL